MLTNSILNDDCDQFGNTGDLNGDGNIDVVDIVWLIDFILNSEYTPIGDISQDGQLNITDIVLLVNLIIGG